MCGFCCLRLAELVKGRRGVEKEVPSRPQAEDEGRTYVKMEGGVCGGIFVLSIGKGFWLLKV